MAGSYLLYRAAGAILEEPDAPEPEYHRCQHCGAFLPSQPTVKASGYWAWHCSKCKRVGYEIDERVFGPADDGVPF